MLPYDKIKIHYVGAIHESPVLTGAKGKLPCDKIKIHYVGATCGRPFVYKCNIFSAQDPSLRSRMTRGLFVFL